MSEFAAAERISNSQAVTTPHNDLTAARLTREEIVRAIQTLRDAEKTALMKIARAYARKTPYDHEDLIHEAFARVLGGQRGWPRDVPALLFLGGVVRSIAWDWKHDQQEDETDPQDPRAAERTAIAKLDAANILKQFDDDPVAKKIVFGMMEGLRGDELRELSGLSKTEYESKRTKIRRRIERLSL
jgi:hypothetical protein